MATRNQRQEPEFDLPEGFTPVTRAPIDGWYVNQKGNKLQGILEDKFVVRGQFGAKNVFKFKVTTGTTLCNVGDDDATEELGEGSIIGVDQKGFLKGLDDIEKGREVFIVCTGKQDPKDVKKGQSPAWMFLVGAMPF